MSMKKTDRGKLPVTEYSCPDCSGVLKLEQEGRHREYRCQVGHRYSTQSLLVSKERQVESTIWMAAAFLEQLVLIYERMASELNQPRSESSRLLQKRMTEARRQQAQLIEMIEQTHAWT